MILRIILFGFMATGLLGFGLILWITSRGPTNPAAAKITTIAVLAAAHELHPGSLIKPEDLIAKPLKQADLPPDASPDTPDGRRGLTGAMVRRALGPQDIIRPQDVMRPGEHGFLAAVLAPGMRAVTVGVDVISGTAGLIWPGDRVDVILTQSMDQHGAPPGRAGRRRSRAERCTRDRDRPAPGRRRRARRRRRQGSAHRHPGSHRRGGGTAGGRHPPGPAVARRALHRTQPRPAGSRRRQPSGPPTSPPLWPISPRTTPPAWCASSRAPPTARNSVSDARFRPAAGACCSRTAPVAAQPAPASLTLETGAGRVVTLDGPAANVFVADPKVAEVRPASASTLFVFGVGPGRTTRRRAGCRRTRDQRIAGQRQPVELRAPVRPRQRSAHLLPGSHVAVAETAQGADAHRRGRQARRAPGAPPRSPAASHRQARRW